MHAKSILKIRQLKGRNNKFALMNKLLAGIVVSWNLCVGQFWQYNFTPLLFRPIIDWDLIDFLSSVSFSASSTHQLLIVSAIVEFDYQANEPDELNLVKGAIITNIRKQTGGWWHGVVAANGKSGMFPDNFVKLLDQHHDDKVIMRWVLSKQIYKELLSFFIRCFLI